MFERQISPHLQSLARQYPVVTLTGPRQSGKTTLVKNIFPKKTYISLEDIDERTLAQQDPRGFLAKFGVEGGVIDEVQYVPELFSYIQTRVDNNQSVGEFILTGSQNFLLLERITQSLAGRTAILHLLPLSYYELGKAGEHVSINSLMFRGMYPRVQAHNLDASEWNRNYINTYVERDVRQIKNITDVSKFQTFLRLCAGRIGQLANLSSLGTECGIDQSTVRSWLSILETCFIIYPFRPYYKNFNKRVVKQHKLYFYDTGLAAYLLGIQREDELNTHYMRGHLFENFVVNELIKARFNRGQDNNFYFWRDNHGHEVDVVAPLGSSLVPIEIKIGATINQGFFSGVSFWQKLTGQQLAYVVYNGDSEQSRSNGVSVINWRHLNEISRQTDQPL